MEAERALIDRAMAGVTIVVCPRCKGAGSVGLSSLSCVCPVCLGARVVTERGDG